jgi:NADH dehydrogenase
VRGFTREWVIVRPGAVYGPGDEHLSVMLRMVRTLPVIPSIGDGHQRFQPIWHEDLAAGLAVAVEKPGIGGRVLEVGGTEVTTQHDLIAKMQRMTGRHVPRIPVPDFVASLAVRGMSAAGFSSPVNESQLDMLREEILIGAGKTNALVDELGVTPTPLDEGLRRFLTEQAEQLPGDGVGTLQRKTFSVEANTGRTADWLFDYLGDHLLDLMPRLVDVDPEGSNPPRIVEGETLTLALPMRGHMQVRVVEVAQRRITLMTLEGHPLAGAVRFIVRAIAGGVGFDIEAYDRPANVVDWLLMRPIGDRLQESTWLQLAKNVARVLGVGDAEVTHRVKDLDEEEAKAVQRWARELTTKQRRADTPGDIERAAQRAP